MIYKTQLTKGCPNGCEYCHEPQKVSDLGFNEKILNKKGEIQILDMNFLSNPNAIDYLKRLKKGKYTLICGLDYRRLTPEIAQLLKDKGFFNVRWAWDYKFNEQIIQYRTYKILEQAGFIPRELSVFILTNWKVSYKECLRKLDLLKVWRVKVNDCCFDGGYKIAKPKYWDIDEIKDFRRKCKTHNLLVRRQFDPEFRYCRLNLKKDISLKKWT